MPIIRSCATVVRMPSLMSDRKAVTEAAWHQAARARSRRLLVVGFLLVFLVDQITKQLALAAFDMPGDGVVVTFFFNLTLVFNRGVSFGMLAEHGELARWGLAAMATVVAVLLGRWAWKGERPLTALGLGLVAGGAIGNALDRVRIGAVVDFLDLHYAGWHWPAFNIADAGITLGVILLLVDGLFGRDPDGPEKT